MDSSLRSFNSIEDIAFAVRRIDELESKLAKAVEGIEFYANQGNWVSNQPYESAEIDFDEGEKARTIYAELKGQDDA